jgi:hypothetical protein
MEPEDPHWQARIAFRDYLRQHPEARGEYERLKFRLAGTFANDRESYTDGKKEFVASTVSRKSRGLKAVQPEKVLTTEIWQSVTVKSMRKSWRQSNDRRLYAY